MPPSKRSRKLGTARMEVMWKCWLQGMEFAEAAVRKECEARIIMLENDRDGMHRNWDAACHDIAELQAKCEADARDAARLRELLSELIAVWINGRKVHDGIPLPLRERIDAVLKEQP